MTKQKEIMIDGVLIDAKFVRKMIRAAQEREASIEAYPINFYDWLMNRE